MARGLTLDAGVLIAADRNDRRVWAFHRARVERGTHFSVPAPALAQAWRGSINARLARFLSGCEIVAMDEDVAKRAGELCGLSGASDVVDAAVIVTALRRGHDVLTTDARDMRRLAAVAGPVRVIDLRARY